MDRSAERLKEKLYPFESRKSYDSSQPSSANFCCEFSSILLVSFAVLGTPTEGYQKSGTVHKFWYNSQLLTMEMNIIVYWTVPLGGNEPYCTERVIYEN